MASSTEEVSGTNDLSAESKQHDTTDTEQKFGMYMREFDFLEYELESLEGESVDNFNWGVRRPSLSHLEGGSNTSLSSASGFGQAKTFSQEGRDDLRNRDNRADSRYKHSGKTQKSCKHTDHSASNKKDSTSTKQSKSHPENDDHRNISPVLRNLGTNRNSGVGAEESSDDEMGSQTSARSIDGISGASSISTTSSGIFPPTSLPLNSIGKMRSSTPQSETESASDCSDDGELSDHDLTPCNPSPSFPLHGWAALGGAGRGNGACIDHDDIEEDWRNHVQNVTNNPTNEMLLSTFVAFGKLFNELKDKVCVLTQDASVELTKEKSTWNQELIDTASEHLQTLTDILSEEFLYPHVWCDFDSVGGRSLIERMKFNILEIQENFENFLDKKEMTFECLDGIKAHQKLVSLGENIGEYPTGMEIDQVDLCRYLYKLHFQLLMFLESFSKLLRLISQSHSDITSDKSTEIALIQSELKKVFKLTNKELEEEIQKNGELNVKSQQVTSESQEITGIDETVESGVDDLQRIQIDDVGITQDEADLDDESIENTSSPTIKADITNLQECESNTSPNSSGNNSNDTLCPQLSPSASPNTSPKDIEDIKSSNNQLTLLESEMNIVELITKSAWLDSVKAFKLHKQKWPEAFASDYENHIGSLGNEEDMYAMLNIYCKHLSQLRILTTHPLAVSSGATKIADSSACSIFVMTLTDHDMAKNVSRLMDASLQLLATVKLMETQLTRRKQSMSAQAVATVTERVYKQQEQVTQEIQQHHAHQQILQKQQLKEEKLVKEDDDSNAPESWQPVGQNNSEDKTPPKSPQPENCSQSNITETPEQTEPVNNEEEHETCMTETIQSSL